MATETVSTLDFQSDLQKLTRDAGGNFVGGACVSICRIIIKLLRIPIEEQEKISFLVKLTVLIREITSFKREGYFFRDSVLDCLLDCFGLSAARVIVIIEDKRCKQSLYDEIFTLVFVVCSCFNEDILSMFPETVQEFYANQQKIKSAWQIYL